jgi:hypothetical protein
MIVPFADWPQWLKALVMVPHCVLIGLAMYWWPKTRTGWRKLGFVVAYLMVFLVVMIFVFHFRD